MTCVADYTHVQVCIQLCIVLFSANTFYPHPVRHNQLSLPVIIFNYCICLYNNVCERNGKNLCLN